MGFVSKAISSAISTVTKVVVSNVAKRGGWKGLLSGGLKQFAFSFIASAVLSFAYKKLAGKPKQPDFNSFTNEAIQRKSLIRSPVADRSIIYGSVRKSGSIVHAETLNNNADLYLVIALCGHEVNSIGSVFFAGAGFLKKLVPSHPISIPNRRLMSAGSFHCACRPRLFL